MALKEIKVQITLSEGYEERFTAACIKVAKKREESGSKVLHRENQEKIAEAV